MIEGHQSYLMHHSTLHKNSVVHRIRSLNTDLDLDIEVDSDLDIDLDSDIDIDIDSDLDLDIEIDSDLDIDIHLDIDLDIDIDLDSPAATFFCPFCLFFPSWIASMRTVGRVAAGGDES